MGVGFFVKGGVQILVSMGTFSAGTVFGVVPDWMQKGEVGQKGELNDKGEKGAGGQKGVEGASGTNIGQCPIIDTTASSSGWVYTQNNTRCDYAGVVNDHRDIKCQKLDNNTIYEFRIHGQASGGHWGWYISDDNTIGTEGVTAISGGNIHAALTSNHPSDNWIGMGDGSNNIVMNQGFDWTTHNTTEKLSGFNWGNQVHVVVCRRGH